MNKFKLCFKTLNILEVNQWDYEACFSLTSKVQSQHKLGWSLVVDHRRAPQSSFQLGWVLRLWEEVLSWCIWASVRSATAPTTPSLNLIFILRRAELTLHSEPQASVWPLVPSDSSDIKLQVKTGTVEDDFKVHNPIKVKGWTRLDFAAKNSSAVVFFSWSFYKQEEGESVIKTRLPGSDLNIAAELEGV